jgi:superfamily II RNA helicase
MSVDNINLYIDCKSKLNNIIKDLENIKYNNIVLLNQINILSSFLLKYDYIDINYIVKIKGKLILEINECNPYLLIEIIQHNKFNNLNFSEIVGLCSILINENKSNDIYISDLDCSDICFDILYFLEKIQNIYLKEETNINNLIPYPYNLDWNLNYSMFNSIKLWADNNDWNYIINQENNLYLGNFFQGNFIKTILRITNILKNIENISKIFNNINIMNKLENFEEKLIRDIVITDSLYII